MKKLTPFLCLYERRTVACSSFFVTGFLNAAKLPLGYLTINLTPVSIIAIKTGFLNILGGAYNNAAFMGDWISFL